VAQVFKYLHILKREAIAVKDWRAGAEESHKFDLVRIQPQPFGNCVSMESVKLELEVRGSQLIEQCHQHIQCGKL